MRALIATLALAAAAGADSTAAAERPNLLVILADDLGFSDLGCYGGEIATPNLDRLAREGLRFTRFYNTARCWPTRSCLLSGYYAQQIRMDPPRGRLPEWTRLLPHYLRPLGYRSYHSGKWHLLGAPLALADAGFDHSYRLEDTDRYFSPHSHFEDDKELPAPKLDEGYYATTAIADHAIRCLKEHAERHPREPFFQYVAFIAPHFPLHVPADDFARYRDRYRQGWDVVRRERWERMRAMGIVDSELSAVDPALKPRYLKPGLLETIGPGEIDHAAVWTELSAEQQSLQATKMALHAAMVDRMDHEIGRVVDELRAMGALDNTVIFFLSDNGADATLLVRGDGHDRQAPPGSAASFYCLGPGWASASNAPFRRHKVWVHEGGISTPLIVHWPRGIAARGELRRQVGHVIDFVPTIVELAGGLAASTADRAAPPLQGRSLVPAIAGDEPVEREYLFFSHEGNRALRVGDWKLVSASELGNAWELYDLSRDRAESVNLAGKEPERLGEMAAEWTRLADEFRRTAGEP
jgi:arylsulfatase